MEKYRCTQTSDGRSRVEVPYRGARLMDRPMYNKSSGFTLEEREAFKLHGLLPEVVSTMEMQVQRAYRGIMRKQDALERYIGLVSLQERNEHLFYRVLLEHLEEFLPIVYTPTVGQASKEYSHIFRRARGLWITPAHKGKIAKVLRNAPFEGVKLIVATDNQAILGIGDQGAGGIVIPIGKLAIYSAAAGIHPAKTLPISLDVGTDNETLLADDLYLGWRQPRIRGEEYFSLVDEFVEAIGEVFPGVLLQWEDFQKANAFELLERYRDTFLSFNDDIQGTGATALAGIMAGCRAAGTQFSEQKVAIVGGGAAGIGIANQLRAAFEREGLSGDALVRSIAVLDSRGLIVDDRERLDSYKRRLAWPAALASEVGLSEDRSLENVVAAYRPTVLIGTSGQPGIFGEALVREMARHVERPIIMPFSNPTALSEAVPKDLVQWTEGRALIATGSPFEPLEYAGRKFRFGQGNNALIFPGVGLGALVSRARRVSDRMFSAAAEELARSTTPGELATGQLYPSIHRLREVTRSVATAVIREAGEEGVGRVLEGGELVHALDEAMWVPEYPELVPV